MVGHRGRDLPKRCVVGLLFRCNRAGREPLWTHAAHCGQLDDVAEYVNPDLLEEDWPKIRRLTARQLVQLWEQQLPQLAVA